MRSKKKLLCRAGVAVMAVIGVVLSAEKQTTPSSAGIKASVAVRITPTRQSDRPGGSAVSSDFLPGESKRLNLTAGRGDDLCDTGVWAIEPYAAPNPEFQARVDAQEAAALYVWHFDVGMREVATDRIVFDLFWERMSRSRPNTPLRGKQSLILREGQSHTIDLIHGAQNTDCMSVVVDIIAHVNDDVTLQDKTLEWDVWFSGAQSGPSYVALTSPQGESASFQFDPIPLSTVQPGGADGATIHVYGQLKGRVRTDGTIDVALTAIRFVNSGPQNRTRPPRSLGLGNSGQKNFIMKPGETIRIVLPPVNSAPPVQFQTDPATGERKVTAVPRPAQPAGPPAVNEMSITVQARVR